MLVTCELQDDICILRLEGRFVTGGDVAYLRTKTDEIRASGCRKVLADFQKVPYIDSTGIAFVVGLYTTLTKTGNGGFAIASPSPRVREVLDLTRLSTVIPVCDDIPSALALLRSVPHVMHAEKK